MENWRWQTKKSLQINCLVKNPQIHVLQNKYTWKINTLTISSVYNENMILWILAEKNVKFPGRLNKKYELTVLKMY